MELHTLHPAPGHLTGLMPPEAERVLLLAFNALALVFAARKYTQAVKDDIGDKSVFQCASALCLHAFLGAAYPHVCQWGAEGICAGELRGEVWRQQPSAGQYLGAAVQEEWRMRASVPDPREWNLILAECWSVSQVSGAAARRAGTPHAGAKAAGGRER